MCCGKGDSLVSLMDKPVGVNGELRCALDKHVDLSLDQSWTRTAQLARDDQV